MPVSARQAKERKARAIANAIARAQGHAEVLYLASQVKGGDLEEEMKYLVTLLNDAELTIDRILRIMSK